jgi:hypothetical protein
VQTHRRDRVADALPNRLDTRLLSIDGNDTWSVISVQRSSLLVDGRAGVYGHEGADGMSALPAPPSGGGDRAGDGAG